MSHRVDIATTLLGICVLAAGLVGCSSPKPGVPSPSPSASAGGAGTSDAHQPVIKVTNPIDVSKYVGNPCAMLTQEQATGFGANRPGKIISSGFVGCTWHTEQSTAFGTGVNDKQANGLTDIYRLHETVHQFDYFQPTTIDGYPAVADNLTADDLSYGNCDVMVAVSDTMILDADVQGSHTGDPCGSAKRLAATALQNVKAGV